MTNTTPSGSDTSRARAGRSAAGTGPDITHLVEMFSPCPRRTEQDDHARRRMLALALDGLSTARTELPGPQPDWAEYQRSWGVSDQPT
ncbi:hypothetical protein ACFWBC_13430 [Streptomyces sp. NPDC059985]|uniref:hypothetical protein n=1 Tax=Streptomyces sp. NPDC059985 TaxID=3347025 RepID=UPI0036809478